MIEFGSRYWVLVICGLAAWNVWLWLNLICLARTSWRSMHARLNDLVRGFARRDADPNGHPLDAVDAFLADVQDIVEQPRNSEELVKFSERLRIKDESRAHELTHSFETKYSFCRASIEAFPLMGILGTVLAIAAGMGHASGDGDSSARISQVVSNFGESVYCTGWGIFFAALFSLVNGYFEPKFDRVIKHRHMLEALVLAAKKKACVAAAIPQQSS